MGNDSISLNSNKSGITTMKNKKRRIDDWLNPINGTGQNTEFFMDLEEGETSEMDHDTNRSLRSKNVPKAGSVKGVRLSK